MWAGVVCVHRLEEELKALEVEAASLQEDAELPMHLKAGGELSGFAVQIKNVAFRYGPDSPVLFRGAELGVDSKSRIVLLGENVRRQGIDRVLRLLGPPRC